MAVIAPPRQPDSRDTDSIAEPGRGGEALIEEAKQHARLRRRRMAIIAVAASVAIAGVAAAAVVAGGSTGSSSVQRYDDPALTGVPAAGNSGRLVASWGVIHSGWMLVYADGRTLRYPDGGPIQEQFLTEFGLRLITSGIIPEEEWSRGRMPSGSWAESGGRIFAPSSYAVCAGRAAEEGEAHDRAVPATSILGEFPAEFRSLLRGTQRTYEPVVFRQVRQDPHWIDAGYSDPVECFTLSPATARALTAYSMDRPERALEEGGDFLDLPGMPDGMYVGIQPVMPHGQVVHWGG